MAGMQNGYASKRFTVSRFSRTAFKNERLMMAALASDGRTGKSQWQKRIRFCQHKAAGYFFAARFCT